MVDKTKKIYKILSQFLLLGLSHLAHPPPEPRCYTASHSNPLCILHALLWEGYHAATVPFHVHGYLCCVRPKATNISPRQIPRKE